MSIWRRLAYDRYKRIFSTKLLDYGSESDPHASHSKAAHVRAYDETVVAIGTVRASRLRAQGVPVVEVESLLAAALYVPGARPAVLRVSLADPLGFFDVLLDRDEAQRRLVA